MTTFDSTFTEFIGLMPMLWAGFCMVLGSFAGGFVAARLSSLKRKADGILHGAVTWAVTTILFAGLASAIGVALVGGIFSSMTQLAQVQEQVADGEGALGEFLRENMEAMGPLTLATLKVNIQAGQRDAAVNLILASTDLDVERAREVVDQAVILHGTDLREQPDQVAPTPDVPAEVTAVRKPRSSRELVSNELGMRRGGAAAWLVFGAVLVALSASLFGGRLGVLVALPPNPA